MNQYLVVLLDERGQPWASPKTLRVAHGETPEEAVRDAHPFPPSYHVHIAAVWQIEGIPTHVDVNVPRPEWGKAHRLNERRVKP